MSSSEVKVDYTTLNPFDKNVPKSEPYEVKHWFQHQHDIKIRQNAKRTFIPKFKHTLNDAGMKHQNNLQNAIAMLNSRFYKSYAAIYRCLNELVVRSPGFKPVDVLDYGAGVGPGAFVLRDIYGDKVSKINLYEPNKFNRKIGKYMSSIITEIEINWVDNMLNVSEQKYDLIILSHVMQEIDDGPEICRILDILWRCLKPDGMFLLIEPGSPKGFRYIHDAREIFINRRMFPQFENYMYTSDVSMANIIAPCPHDGSCPLAKDTMNWCHFSQIVYRWPKEVFPYHPREHPEKSEKFSYLLLKNGNTPRSINSDRQLNIETSDDAITQSYFWARVVFATLKKGKHVIVNLCSNPYYFEKRIIGKSSDKLVYKYARKLKWGSLWPFEKDDKKLKKKKVKNQVIDLNILESRSHDNLYNDNKM